MHGAVLRQRFPGARNLKKAASQIGRDIRLRRFATALCTLNVSVDALHLIAPP
jgi:hypothetical protein